MMRPPQSTGIDLPQRLAGHSGSCRGRREAPFNASALSPSPSLRRAQRGAPLTGRAAGNIAIERTAAISIVFGALADPRTNGISVADRQLLLAVRHTHVRGGAPIEEPHQVAALRVAGDDHRAELGALHQPLIGREVEPAFFVARAAALVAAHTSACEDGQYVLGEALRFRRA